MRGRQVRIVAMRWQRRSKLSPLERLAICDEWVSSIKPNSVDVVCFPESFLHDGLAYRHISEVENEYLPATRHARRWAKLLQAHIVLPIVHNQKGRYTNSVLTFSRKGLLIGRYDKQHPWPSSLDVPDLERGVSPGRGGGVLDADFGRMGVQTCFDVNWAVGWEELREQQAKFVLFPSEYGGGFALRARAWQIRAPIVGVILGGPCRVVDMTGAEITRNCSRVLKHMSVVTINTNRALVHMDHNAEPLRRLARDSSIKLRRLRYDNVFLVEASPMGEDLDCVLREYGIRKLDAYLSEAHEIIESRRENA